VLAPAVAVVAGCGGGHAAAPARAPARPGAASPYAYDRSAPLGLRDLGVVNRPYPIPIHDVSYASPKGGRVPAYLVEPRLKGRKPAVIYLHGAGGSRIDLLPLATWFAARGAVTMTIDDAYARTPAPAVPPGMPGVRRDRDLTVQTVVDVRRAVDVLRSLPSVDPKRIAFVGFSAGARVGAIIAGVEHRIHSFVLVSGGSQPVSAYVAAVAPRLRPEVWRTLTVIDSLRWVRHAAPSALLLQDGRHDRIVPRAELVALARAASRPKEVRWYDGGHSPTDREVSDQMAWLARRLGLGGPVVAGAVAGP
jgi:dienelactone hydrolase